MINCRQWASFVPHNVTKAYHMPHKHWHKQALYETMPHFKTLRVTHFWKSFFLKGMNQGRVLGLKWRTFFLTPLQKTTPSDGKVMTVTQKQHKCTLREEPWTFPFTTTKIAFYVKDPVYIYIYIYIYSFTNTHMCVLFFYLGPSLLGRCAMVSRDSTSGPTHTRP